MVFFTDNLVNSNKSKLEIGPPIAVPQEKDEKAMKISDDLKPKIELAGRSDATVLLTGASGSGKSAIAREIHNRSRRRDRNFISVNLATLHEGTIESEFFGHEKGSFTGADQRRTGLLELGHGGTVFLDEITELPVRLQGRLLEFLQSRNIKPVGGNRETQLDVRVIAATNRNIVSCVRKGEFREDLFHRLRVIEIKMKSLIDRADEFDELLHNCLEEICEKHQRTILKLDEVVAEKLEAHSWPGNFRELQNVLEYAVLSCSSSTIREENLPDWFGENIKKYSCMSSDSNDAFLDLDYHSAIADFEKKYLQNQLSRFQGRINKTAKRIGLNKTTLIRRIRAYDLFKENSGNALS
ncbi:MAG: hypothetical protein A3K03_08290 [Bdellovibrionales bacterium RIFOXYD1_FULL_44_7]|nr:MAG: hypothetical protein A3K03_08290 [Bdellovibrionales bacterium RIFOXYD1_FULL_44_7]